MIAYNLAKEEYNSCPFKGVNLNLQFQTDEHKSVFRSSSSCVRGKQTSSHKATHAVLLK